MNLFYFEILIIELLQNRNCERANKQQWLKTDYLKKKI